MSPAKVSLTILYRGLSGVWYVNCFTELRRKCRNLQQKNVFSKVTIKESEIILHPLRNKAHDLGIDTGILISCLIHGL